MNTSKRQKGVRRKIVVSYCFAIETVDFFDDYIKKFNEKYPIAKVSRSSLAEVAIREYIKRRPV